VPFFPLDIPGLQLWLKADAGLWQDSVGGTPAAADGDVVGAWVDQSGKGNNASQATTSKKPLLKKAIVNGRDVVRFDGTDDWLGLANAAMPVQNHTVFVVCNVTTTTAGKTLIGRAWNFGAFYFLVEASNHATNPRQARYVIDDGIVRSTVNADAAWKILMGIYDSVDNRIRINGGDEQVNVNAAGTLDYHANDAATIGAVRDTSNNVASILKGDISEIILYNSALSAANRQRVEGYLNTRYGVY